MNLIDDESHHFKPDSCTTNNCSLIFDVVLDIDILPWYNDVLRSSTNYEIYFDTITEGKKLTICSSHLYKNKDRSHSNTNIYLADGTYSIRGVGCNKLFNVIIKQSSLDIDNLLHIINALL